jgi:hypothetical protein
MPNAANSWLTFSPTSCAANGVDFRAPLKNSPPELVKIISPFTPVPVIIVLLKVD